MKKILKVKVEELDIVLIKWVDAFDAFGAGWFEWEEVLKKGVLANCTSVGYLLYEDKEKIVIIGDETGEFASRITVIPSSWQLTRETLRKGKKKPKGSV
jgi:hypothetical protein